MKLSSYIAAGLLLTCAVARADTMNISYSEGKNTVGAPIGIGFGDYNEIESAFFLPASTVELLAGNNITGINGCLSSAADIETVYIFIRDELEGENLAYFRLVPNQLNQVKRGVNKLKFKTPFAIPSGTGKGLYIGFGYVIRDVNTRGLSANSTPIPNAFFLRRADGKWYDFSTHGSASIEAVLEGDNLPERNLHLSRVDTPDVFVVENGAMPVTYFVHNFGNKTITGFDMVAEIDGKEVDRVRVTGDVESNAMKTGVVTFRPGLTVAEDKEITYRLENLAEGEDQDKEDNKQAGAFEVVLKSYPRKVLSEEFTTEECGNCPPVIAMLHEMLACPEYSDNIIQVAHHSGYKQDFLTTPFHQEYVKLFGGGSFAPGLAADRVKQDPSTIVIFPENENFVEKMWNDRLGIPALVSVDVTATYTDFSQDKMEVTVYGEKSSRHLPENTCATVWLVEDGIEQEEQANAPDGFVHNNVTRACASADYWGDPITFDGDHYSYTCEVAIDENWKKENMRIVAFLGDNTDKWNGHEVLNAASLRFSDIKSSGLDSADSSRIPVDVRYYDLSGREVNASAEGILLKKSVYDDGSARTVKIVR